MNHKRCRETCYPLIPVVVLKSLYFDNISVRGSQYSVLYSKRNERALDKIINTIVQDGIQKTAFVKRNASPKSPDKPNAVCFVVCLQSICLLLKIKSLVGPDYQHTRKSTVRMPTASGVCGYPANRKRTNSVQG